MKLMFYPRLAATGMAKNRKLYLPYLLTCAGMVMVFYIVSFLSVNRYVASLRGGETLQTILSLGVGVLAVFSLIFLFYTNSFLIRRRKREFGLYNILGMGKKNIARVLIHETFFIAAVALVAGLLSGILFSKAAELCITRLLEGTARLDFTVEPTSIVTTTAVFCVVFVLILLNSLRQIHISKPVELLRSEAAGEKPPRTNWLLALLGALILGGAYALALSIGDPIEAIFWFFVAVLMVIAATYLLFIAGVTALCRLLQKNKAYYYSTGRFISLSSMAFRMKRNGAGLASICILSTMVLVILSSTTCLFAGTEDMLGARYPRDVEINLYSDDPENQQTVSDAVNRTLTEAKLEPERLLSYRYTSLLGYVDQENVVAVNDDGASGKGELWQIYAVPLEDYNRLTGESETLGEGEALYYAKKGAVSRERLSFLQGNGETAITLRLTKSVEPFLENGNDASSTYPTLYLVVNDEERETLLAWRIGDGSRGTYFTHTYLGFDLAADDKTQIDTAGKIADAVYAEDDGDEYFPPVNVLGAAGQRAEFYAVYGGLFFLGILLGSVFLLGAVLLMYYKQMTEGYEGASRFDIMQKVGMTKREIRKSVNSQVLTVFFLPLVLAGVHITFAFPMISKLLALLGLSNTGLFLQTMLLSFFAYALFYVFVYILTSRSYYSVVSGSEKAAG